MREPDVNPNESLRGDADSGRGLEGVGIVPVDVFVTRDSSVDFGVFGLELSLNDRLREGMFSASFWERDEDDVLRSEDPGDGFRDGLDSDDFRDRAMPKIERSSNFRR